MSREALPPGLLTEIEQTLIDDLRAKLAPVAWSWYDNHKGDSVKRLFGVYTVSIGSFGIAEAVLTFIVGPRPTTAATT